MADGEKVTNESQKAAIQDSKQEGPQELQRRIQEYLHALKEYERDFESRALIGSGSGGCKPPTDLS
jgi:hypothetical protein